MLHVDPRQCDTSSSMGYSGCTSSTTMMVRWKLARLSLTSCLQGWSISRVTDTRTLASRSRPQVTLWNRQHGNGIKAMLKEGSDWKKSKPVDGVNISVKAGEHCPEGVQQFYTFGTPDRYEEKNIDSVIRYICSLEGTEQGNVPVVPESKLSGSLTMQKRNDVWVASQCETSSGRCRQVLQG